MTEGNIATWKIKEGTTNPTSQPSTTQEHGHDGMGLDASDDGTFMGFLDWRDSCYKKRDS